jgi:hypothetical protein
MKALFVELPAFQRFRPEYLTDEAYRGLQNGMLKAPEAGDVITGMTCRPKTGQRSKKCSSKSWRIEDETQFVC